MIGRKTRQRHSAVATTHRICEMNSMAVAASVYNLPMKQACVFEHNTEFHLAPATTTLGSRITQDQPRLQA